MKRKTVELSIKTADDSGTFTGLASVFDNLDAHGDIVRRGAFTKSIGADQTIPLLWEHKADDPRNYVGDVTTAVETAEGLQITGTFDLDSDFGRSAYRNVKGRRVSGLSIGYAIRKSTKTAAGHELTDLELIEISVVARGANDRALINSVKSASRPTAPIRAALARATATAYLNLKENPDMMTNAKLTTLTKDRDSQLAAVKTIIDTADELGRDLTADEASTVDEATQKAKSLDGEITKARTELAIIDGAKALAAEIGKPRGLGDDDQGDDPATPHLAMTGKHAKSLGRKIVANMPRDHSGTKALAAGQQTTSTIVLPDVVPIGRPAVSVLDLLRARQVTPSYAYIRQSSRANNAAPVAVGGLKPTSDPGLTTIPNRLRVVAHVSAELDQYMLSDNVDLERFVVDEMVWGLRRAVETEVLAGDGTGEHLLGILNTSGIVTQAFATNILTSIRKGLTALDVAGYEPGVIVVSAADWEAIELLETTSGATDVRGVPIDPVTRRLYGVPVALNQGLGAKTGLILGDGAVTVDHDGEIQTKWSENVSDNFKRNYLIARVEGRFGVSVAQPGAVVKVSTAA